jgi:hypothetical protein
MVSTYLRLALNIRDTPRTVIRAARQKLSEAARQDPDQRQARKHFYRLMLAYHAKAQELVTDFHL